MATYDTSDPAALLTGMRLARQAIGKGELVVIPTDTVYGVAADAFAPAAVQRLLDAKGRDRTAPPPVLIPGIPTLDALAEVVPDEVRALVAEFWPGGLTVILRARTHARLGSRRDPRHRRAAHAERPDRARAARRDRAARGLERQHDRRARRRRPRRRPRRCSGMPWPSTSTAAAPAATTRGSTIVDATGARVARRASCASCAAASSPTPRSSASWGPTDAHNLLPARRRGRRRSSPSGSPCLIYKLSHRYRLYPKIRARDVHTRPTPRLGGIAMFLGIVVAFAVGSFLPQLDLVYARPGHDPRDPRRRAADRADRRRRRHLGSRLADQARRADHRRRPARLAGRADRAASRSRACSSSARRDVARHHRVPRSCW